MKKDPFKKLFKNLPTSVGINGIFKWEWQNEKKSKVKNWMKPYQSEEKKFKGRHGITLWWTEKGRGFGQYSLFEDNGKVYVDSECDGKSAVAVVFCKLISEAEDVSPPNK